MNWHRIELVHFAPPLDEWEYPIGRGDVRLVHSEYPVVKTTPKGVWISLSPFHGEQNPQRFVLMSAKRQWASPTFELAKEKFVHRKKRHLQILREQIKDIELALSQVEDFKP